MIDHLKKLGLSSAEQDGIVSQRIGQGAFRKDLLSIQGKCAICGLQEHSLLVASHIKGWKQSRNIEEQLDVNNGLLLCSMHDALFDKHFISFDPNNDYKIVISNHIGSSDFHKLNIRKAFELDKALIDKYDQIKFNKYLQHHLSKLK